MTEGHGGDPTTGPSTTGPSTTGPSTTPPSTTRASTTRGPARHERPVIDALGLEAARHGDRLLAAAIDLGVTRWAGYLEPLPEHLRDDEPAALRRTAMRARAAYGPKDSIRDALPASLTEPFLDAIDRLLRELNRSRG